MQRFEKVQVRKQKKNPIVTVQEHPLLRLSTIHFTVILLAQIVEVGFLLDECQCRYTLVSI